VAIDNLSELERDALTELVNIAVSGAATRLRAMVGSEVSLKVPVVDIHEAADGARALVSFNGEALTVVRQEFSGRLNGQTMLLFSPSDGRTLARAVLGEGYFEQDYAELLDDTLGEVGNVLLLGLLATIGSMLSVTFKVAIPTVSILVADELFPAEDGRVVLLIHVDFSVSQINARGYFALVLGLGSFAVLHEIIRAFLADLLETAPA
jgi:chemotaxis protein CheC